MIRCLYRAQSRDLNLPPGEAALILNCWLFLGMYMSQNTEKYFIPQCQSIGCLFGFSFPIEQACSQKADAFICVLII